MTSETRGRRPRSWRRRLDSVVTDTSGHVPKLLLLLPAIFLGQCASQTWLPAMLLGHCASQTWELSNDPDGLCSSPSGGKVTGYRGTPDCRGYVYCADGYPMGSGAGASGVIACWPNQLYDAKSGVCTYDGDRQQQQRQRQWQQQEEQ